MIIFIDTDVHERLLKFGYKLIHPNQWVKDTGISKNNRYHAKYMYSDFKKGNVINFHEDVGIHKASIKNTKHFLRELKEITKDNFDIDKFVLERKIALSQKVSKKRIKAKVKKNNISRAIRKKLGFKDESLSYFEIKDKIAKLKQRQTLV